MKKISFIILFFLFLMQTKAQWISYYASNMGTDIDLSSAKGLAVTVDLWGNCYVTGYTSTPETGNDIFVVKYGPAGDTAWTRSYNGSENSNDQGNAIAVDYYGNVYVTGTAKILGKSNEIILLKYNTFGTLQWGWPKTFGETDAPKEDMALAIALDQYGNIYLTGYSTGIDGRNNLIIVKYDFFGTRKWFRTEDGADDLDARGSAITIDSWGNILATGYCTTYEGQNNIIAVKYSGGGNLLWSNTYGGNSEDKAFGIVTDDGCNIYITGYTTVDPQTGNTDYITLKYSTSGSLLWYKTYNGNGNGENSEDKAFGIVVDQASSIYITGYATDSLSMKDYVTIKYDSEGNQLWIASYNGTGNGDDKANAIGLLNDGNIVVTGASWGTNNNDDYATVKYDASNGAQLQASRYSLNGVSEDVAKDVAASTTSSAVYITGYSELLINGPVPSTEITTQMLSWGNRSELNTNNSIAQKFNLSQNYPNPFNPSTTINFNIPQAADVKLTVYDMLGKVVDIIVNQHLEAGSYSINYTNKDLSSGIYFYELRSGIFKDIKKMTLVK